MTARSRQDCHLHSGQGTITYRASHPVATAAWTACPAGSRVSTRSVVLHHSVDLTTRPTPVTAARHYVDAIKECQCMPSMTATQAWLKQGCFRRNAFARSAGWFPQHRNRIKGGRGIGSVPRAHDHNAHRDPPVTLQGLNRGTPRNRRELGAEKAASTAGKRARETMSRVRRWGGCG